MKIKHLIIVSLILAILTIGAVSAGEADDDALAVSDDGVDEVSISIDETDDATASVNDEVISDGGEDGEDSLDGFTKKDFTVEIRPKVNISNEDEYVVSYTCPENVSQDSYIKVVFPDESEYYPQFPTSSEDGGPVNLTADEIGLYPFNEFNIHVYYCLSDDSMMEIASGTVSIVKTLDKDDFKDVEYNENQVVTSQRDNEILTLFSYVNGTFIITTDKGHKYECENGPYEYGYVWIQDLNITENGTYEINVKFIAEDGAEVDVATYNITVDIDWNEPYDPLLNLQNSVNLLDKSEVLVQIDDEIPFVGELTITIDGKQGYSKTLAEKDGRFEIMIFDLNSVEILPGNHTVTVEYLLETGEKHSITDVVEFYEKITVSIPDRMSVGEEKYIVVVSNETTGNVSVYIDYDNDVLDYVLFVTENITDGVAKIPLSSLSEGDYGFNVTVFSTSCPDRVEFSNSINVMYNSNLFTFDVDPKEIFYGKNTLINFTGPFDEGCGVEIYVDDILFATIYDFDSLFEIGDGLAVGQHKIGVTYYGDQEFYSNSALITVKEAPVPVDSGLELLIDNVEEGTNVTIVVKTNSSFTGNVDVVIGNVTIPVAVSAGEGNATVLLKADSYEAKAIFKATDVFEAKNVTKSFNVTAKAPSGNGTNTNGTDDKTPVTPPKADKITLTLKKVKVKKSAKKLVLQATLKINGKSAKKGTKVIFKFNGKKYAAKVNAKGVAKVTIKKKVLKKLKVGKKVKYQVSYGKTVKKLSVKVKK